MLLMPNTWSSQFVTIYPFIYPSIGARLVFLLSRQVGFCRFILILTSFWVDTVCSPFIGIFWICQYSTSLGKESSSVFDSFITPNRLLVKGNSQGAGTPIQKLCKWRVDNLLVPSVCSSSTSPRHTTTKTSSPAHVLVPATNQQQLGWPFHCYLPTPAAHTISTCANIRDVASRHRPFPCRHSVSAAPSRQTAIFVAFGSFLFLFCRLSLYLVLVRNKQC
jgi:hypothetical protein